MSNDIQGKRYRGLLLGFLGITFIPDENTDMFMLNATDGSLDKYTFVTGTQQTYKRFT